jgi:phosphate transport system substrate-binding protein
MNDEFLYELRSPPPRAFAAQLKARLDIQASEGRSQRRAFRWSRLGVICMGSVSLAFFSPAVREGATSILFQFRALPSPQPSVQAMRDAPRARNGRPSDADMRSSASSSVPSDQARHMDAPASMLSETHGDLVVDAPSSSRSSTLIAGAQQKPMTRIAYTKELEHLVERLTSDSEALKTVQVTTVEVAAGVDPCARNFDPMIEVIVTERRLGTDRQIQCMSPTHRFVELPFAYDAVVIITNVENTWARSLSRDDLHKLRDSDPSNPLTTWSQVRAEWPTLPMALVGTSFESSLGSRFAGAVGLSRSPSVLMTTKGDHATWRAVESNLGAVGYIDFGTYHTAMASRSAWPAAAAVVNAKGESVMPTVETIQTRKYELSRPIYLYFKVVPPRRVEVYELLDHLLRRSSNLAGDGYVPLGPEEKVAVTKSIRQARYGALR